MLIYSISDPLDTYSMTFDSTQFMAQMAELRNNRDDADVTLNCHGELIKAHSFILRTRYACTFEREITRSLFMRQRNTSKLLNIVS